MDDRWTSGATHARIGDVSLDHHHMRQGELDGHDLADVSLRPFEDGSPMSWLRCDDAEADNPKIVAAGPLGHLLYHYGRLHCARNMTDGWIPMAKIPTLVNFDGISFEGKSINSRTLAESLVLLGLWESGEKLCARCKQALTEAETPTPSIPSFYLHDFLEYNPTKTKLVADKDLRQESRRKAGLASVEARRARYGTAQPVLEQAHEEKAYERARAAEKSWRWRYHERTGVWLPVCDYVAVLKRDGYVCQICKHPVDPENVHFDHVVSLNNGGEHAETNVRVAHPSCNLGRTREEQVAERQRERSAERYAEQEREHTDEQESERSSNPEPGSVTPTASKEVLIRQESSFSDDPARPKRRATKADVVRVFDAWRQATGKNGNTALDPPRVFAIRKMLDLYGLDQCLQAAQGVALSPFHMGRNDRNRQFNDITFVFRNGKLFEEFRDLYREKRTPSPVTRESSHRAPDDAPRPMSEHLAELATRIGVPAEIKEQIDRRLGRRKESA